MNQGPRHPSGGGGKNRRRRGRRPPGHRQGPRGQQQRGTNARNNHGGIYTAPMDHAYRNAGENGKGGRGHFGAGYSTPEPEPLPQSDSAPRIFAFVDDLFFLAKIQEVARKLNVKVEFVKNDKDLSDRMQQNGEEKP